MSHADLSRIEWCLIPMITVGWFGADFPYNQGEVRSDVLERLRTLDAMPWNFFPILGCHICELCPPDVPGGPPTNFGDTKHFVPSDDGLYVAPKLIRHYIEAHGYAPPERFCEALLHCPLPGTQAYDEQLRRFIPAQFHPQIDRCLASYQACIASNQSI